MVKQNHFLTLGHIRWPAYRGMSYCFHRRATAILMQQDRAQKWNCFRRGQVCANRRSSKELRRVTTLTHRALLDIEEFHDTFVVIDVGVDGHKENLKEQKKKRKKERLNPLGTPSDTTCTELCVACVACYNRGKQNLTSGNGSVLQSGAPSLSSEQGLHNTGCQLYPVPDMCLKL